MALYEPEPGSGAWAYRPQYAHTPTGAAVFPNHIRNTWAGPVNPQVYHALNLDNLCICRAYLQSG